MATFAVIDTAMGGDTFYEGMVKDAANWAILEAGYYALVSHTHGEGGTVLSIVAAEANLQPGTTDGEQAICSVNGNVYMWEAGTAKWQPMAGNQYATSGLPTAVIYNILTGTRVYDTTVARMKNWNGSIFIIDDVELRKSFLL